VYLNKPAAVPPPKLATFGVVNIFGSILGNIIVVVVIIANVIKSVICLLS